VAAAILSLRPSQRHAVIEIGIDGAGQMAAYQRLVRPEIVVVTSIGSEHHRSLGTLDATRTEKAAMLRQLPATEVAVLNGDDPNVLWMKTQTSARIVTFGRGEANDVRASAIRLDWPRGTRFTLHACGETRETTIRLIGSCMVYPVLAAVAVGCAEGLALDAMLPTLERLPPTPGRMEALALPNGAWILRDDFKSSLETIHAALEVLGRIPARRLLALGEVTEPPGSVGPVYREIGRRFGGIVRRAVVIGSERSFRSYGVGAARAGLARGALRTAGNRVHQAAAMLREELHPGDVLLIKGRGEQRLERIALLLQERTVRCELERCRVKFVACEACPMLERGWSDRRPGGLWWCR
jgi:UDP-N-acetylmuramoyl-tripeptide--D-alanyl-D-alanine ligase